MFLRFPSISTRDIQDQKGSVCVFPLSTAQKFSLLQPPEIIPFVLAFSSIFLLRFSVLCLVSSVFSFLSERSHCVHRALVFPFFKHVSAFAPTFLSSFSIVLCPSTPVPEKIPLPSHLFFYWLPWNSNLSNQNFINIFVLL